MPARRISKPRSSAPAAISLNKLHLTEVDLVRIEGGKRMGSAQRRVCAVVFRLGINTLPSRRVADAELVAPNCRRRCNLDGGAGGRLVAGIWMIGLALSGDAATLHLKCLGEIGDDNEALGNGLEVHDQALKRRVQIIFVERIAFALRPKSTGSVSPPCNKKCPDEAVCCP
jgi:hypothetical protein